MNDIQGNVKKSNNQQIDEGGGYYHKIPNKVFYDTDLADKQKLIYAEIYQLSYKDGYCYASNGYIASKLNVTPLTVSRAITKLSDKGYITKQSVKKEATNLYTRKLFINYLPLSQEIKGVASKDEGVISRDKGAYLLNDNGVISRDKQNKISKYINNIYDHDRSIKTIKDKWNSIDELNSIEAITDKRYQDVSYLIKTYGLEKILQAIDNIKNSQYLLGKLNSPPVKFDWFLIADNFVKVLENYYKNREDGTDSTLANNYSW
ncbi:helix-turn-helix domain-containing protein [Anaerococcus sp. Marseille-P3625]|uniref:helix-turn-helix domain-containing protein n=1 Tax=Anaerococcus sp. Marseille-P3625 TaxID=1977277 RepID=UPI000C06F07A|nr:helix-turn-helix domain-containing protein [Anaerococcus sp. Marseille-P3625]